MPNSARQPHQPMADRLLRAPVSRMDMIEGLAQLTTTGAVEVTELVESIHREILLRPFQGVLPHSVNRLGFTMTKKVYDIVKKVMTFSGGQTAAALRSLNGVVNDSPLSFTEKFTVNAINGVMGDHLVHENNPLALDMLLYDRYGNVFDKRLEGRVVILIHGLCMSYHSWHPAQDIGLGEHIVYSQPDTTILYLDYNTGRRISQSGHSFSSLMQELVEDNPNITHIDLIGHSMGGLVARSAMFYGKQECMNWTQKVDHYISLGSPHHGAVLERIGFFLQESLSKVPIAGNLSRLLDLRSAGIIDLRHGSIRHDDWQHLHQRMGMSDDIRKSAPLPSDVNAYLIAATLEAAPKKNAKDILGDGLVSVASALGEHKGEHDLQVPESHKAVFYGVNHMDIQYHERVRQQIIEWLREPHDNKKGHGDRVISVPAPLKKAS